MILMSDENGNLIPVAVDNQGNDGITMDLLWENSSPTSAFSSQSVTINTLRNYKLVMIQFLSVDNTCFENYKYSIIAKNDIGNNASVIVGVATNTTLRLRALTINSTSITFEDAYTINTTTSNNNWAIPLKIYGIK